MSPSQFATSALACGIAIWGVLYTVERYTRSVKSEEAAYQAKLDAEFDQAFGHPTRKEFDDLKGSGGSWAAGYCETQCTAYVVFNNCQQVVRLPTGGVWGFITMFPPGFQYQFSTNGGRMQRAETTQDWPGGGE